MAWDWEMERGDETVGRNSMRRRPQSKGFQADRPERVRDTIAAVPGAPSDDTLSRRR